MIFILFGFNQCHNYLSEDVPIVTKPFLNQRLALLTIKVTSPESPKQTNELSQLYAKYLMDTGFFGRVLSDGIRSANHIDIYTAEVNEYEHFWISSISSLFMVSTLGLLPSIFSKERVLIAEFYVNDRMVGRERYRQKHSTLVGIPFLLIWETGIKEAKLIEYNKERNLINNMIQDYNRFL
ncbi:lipoprotein [Leptospira ryugenii]|uniref:Lipoprotein n=1 Tax=Leptospira ryugenii TaxID=1917863 RepID=A0A2P2E2K2_9LEPT|nr:lipoprotein [Leptospira ryugenii]